MNNEQNKDKNILEKVCGGDSDYTYTIEITGYTPGDRNLRRFLSKNGFFPFKEAMRLVDSGNSIIIHPEDSVLAEFAMSDLESRGFSCNLTVTENF